MRMPGFTAELALQDRSTMAFWVPRAARCSGKDRPTALHSATTRFRVFGHVGLTRRASVFARFECVAGVGPGRAHPRVAPTLLFDVGAARASLSKSEHQTQAVLDFGQDPSGNCLNALGQETLIHSKHLRDICDGVSRKPGIASLARHISGR